MKTKMNKHLKWYQEISLPTVKIRNKNGQLVIPIPKRSADKHNIKADMEVHPIIFMRTDTIHKGEIKPDEVMPILKKKDYIRFNAWKKEEDKKIGAILKSLDNPEDLDDSDIASIEMTLGKKAAEKLKNLKDNHKE